MLKTTALNKPLRFLIILVLMCLLFSGVMAAEELDTEESLPVTNQENPVTGEHSDTNLYPVPPPVVYQSLYPCQACHRKDTGEVASQFEQENVFLGTYIHLPNPKPRMLIQMHQDISLHHAEWMWCLNCHDTDERNYLRLITGEKISFEKSYRLCGECHGTIYRDWKIGIHGRRVGAWPSDGKKLYLLCTHCHDPHQPHFRKLPGKPAPRLPSYGRWGNNNGNE